MSAVLQVEGFRLCHCGTEFAPKVARQRHCSRRCNCRAAGRRREAKRQAARPWLNRTCARWGCGRKFRTRNKLRLFHADLCAQLASQKARRACRAAEARYAQEAVR